MSEKTIIATTENIAGYETKKIVGLVWANATKTKHFGHDLYAVIKSLAGGELKGYTKMTNQAREETINALAKQAEEKQANAVVGTRFGTTQVLPATIEVYAYGTAVVIEKKRK